MPCRAVPCRAMASALCEFTGVDAIRISCFPSAPIGAPVRSIVKLFSECPNVRSDCWCHFTPFQAMKPVELKARLKDSSMEHLRDQLVDTERIRLACLQLLQEDIVADGDEPWVMRFGLPHVRLIGLSVTRNTLHGTSFVSWALGLDDA